MDRLLRWWWSDPFTRHIHPSSQITVPDFVRRRIREVLDWPDDQVKARALTLAPQNEDYRRLETELA